ncbi:MAG: alginate export family protein [Bacteroidales bacterium]|nr:alginate export family protein [Bacteroidales bacterium]
MKPRLLFTLLILPITLPAFSQLTIGAELRPRALLNAGYGTPLPKEEIPRLYVTQRIRLNAGFKQGSIETYISFQDVRFWGGDTQYKSSGTFGNTGSMSLHQGWFKAQLLPWLSVKAGRQLLSYDDQRILSARGWNDSQVSYDALLFQAGNESHKMDLGLSWNAQSAVLTAVPPQKFKTLDFLRYQRTMEQLTYSLIALVTGNYLTDSTEDVRYRATWGANMGYSGHPLEAKTSLYYQHTLNQAGETVSAFCASVNIGVPLAQDKIKISAGLDYISGQDALKSENGYPETSHTFDLLYGRRHGWYGYLDYFSNMPAQGLQDYIVKGEYRLSEKLVLKSDYHYFRLAAALSDPELPGTALPAHLGHELDLKLNWTLSKTAALEAGYSFLVPGPTLEILKGVADTPIRLPQFAYLMISIKPSFTLQ